MRVVSGLLLIVAVAAPTSAFAYSWAPNAIPNGTTYSCATCHLRPTGGAGWNDFGTEIRTLRAINFGGRTVDWAALYDLDSDGDGFTNGAELGDPDGDRTPIPGFAATRPGDATSFPAPCGNAQLDEGEECDGALFADDATCEALGFFGGSLACTTTCEVDDSDCLSEEPDAGGGDAGMDAGGGEDAGMDAGGGEDAGMDAGGEPQEDTVTEVDGEGLPDGGAGSTDVGASADSGEDTAPLPSDTAGTGGADTGTTNETPDDAAEEESGCSAASPVSSSGAWLGGLGVLGLLIRRRRAA